MVAFQLMAKGIRRILDEGKAEDPERLERTLEIFETVGDFSQEDCNILYDSGVFNDITGAYAVRALQEIGLSDRADELLNAIKELHDTTTTDEILKGAEA